jgi:hypothetical protein
VTALTIDGVSTPPGNLSVMQLAFESPAVIVPLVAVPPARLVPPPVEVGLGVAGGLLEGEGDDEGLVLGDGLLVGDGLVLDEGRPPLGAGPPLAEGLLWGDGLLSVAPAPSSPGVPVVAGPLGSLQGPVGEAGFLVISHELRVARAILELALRSDE